MINPRTLKRRESHRIGAPAIEPSQSLVERVEGATSHCSEVQAFFLFQMADLDHSRLVIGIELSEQSLPGDAMPEIVRNISNALPPGEAIDVVQLSGEALSMVALHVPRRLPKHVG